MCRLRAVFGVWSFHFVIQDGVKLVSMEQERAQDALHGLVDHFEALSEHVFAGGVLGGEVAEGVLRADELLDFGTLLARAVGAVGTLDGGRWPGLNLHAPPVPIQNVELEDGLFCALLVLGDFTSLVGRPTGINAENGRAGDGPPSTASETMMY